LSLKILFFVELTFLIFS